MGTTYPAGYALYARTSVYTRAVALAAGLRHNLRTKAIVRKVEATKGYPVYHVLTKSGLRAY